MIRATTAREKQWRGMAALEIDNEFCRGLILRHGAQVISYCPADASDLLWLSKKCVLEPGQAIRGGIPVCWPWFGKDGNPMHGLARLNDWELVTAEDAPDGSTEVEMAFGGVPELDLTLRVIFGSSLRLDLTTVNRSGKEVRLTQALHSYFAVSDVARIRVEGLEHSPFLNALTGARESEDHSIRFQAETDRVYDESDVTCRIIDPAWRRKIQVAKAGSNSTVVWNPWIDKAHRMTDFGDDEYPEMVCVETGNVGRDAVILAPGSGHTLTAEIALV